MKTVILASPNQYGYFTIYSNYVNYLVKEAKVIYVCYDQGEIKFPETKNLKVHYVSLKSNIILRFFRYYRTIIQVYKADLHSKIILKYYFFSSLLNLFISRNDLILDIRTGYISESRLKTFFFNSVLRSESLLFKRVIVLSESLREKLKLRKFKTAIIPLGAERIDSPKLFDKPTLLYVGTITSRNIFQTIEGLSIYLKNTHLKAGIRYYIVGGGKSSDTRQLIDTINRFNLQETVQYEGPVYGEKLKWFFMNCNIGVAYIPMLEDYDCQPATKTIEYLLAGMPVIATETYENKKMISSKNGVLVLDNPQSFAKGLETLVSEMGNFSSGLIVNSVMEFSYENIITTKLKPLLNL